ncbi:pilus assembly protein TadG-related protein [Dankookia sp. GCM10030260]|uniref:pilus assembly protein TadG-related protein n=1 Tax=Dankookia sp. GCM10030260 TaxID=3273390 RepID=UPI003613507C
MAPPRGTLKMVRICLLDAESRAVGTYASLRLLRKYTSRLWRLHAAADATWRRRSVGGRGSVAAMVAISGTVLIGFAGLAVDGGTWYLATRNAATAADLAALAGAAARERGQSAITVATDTAARNGFANGSGTSVTVNNPPPAGSGSFAGNTAAVEVLITQVQPLHFARLFLGTPPTLSRRAVAAANVDEAVCVLALGTLELGGNSTTNARRCALGANATAPGGIRIFGSASVRTAGLVTTGNCDGCTGSDVWTDNTKTAKPYVIASRPSPITDPFADLRNWTPTPPACGPGITFTNNVANISPGQAICAPLSVGTKQTLNLAPGIYYFNGADLTLHGTINGNGVTLVFTGEVNNVGTIRINAEAKGSLRGPATSLVPNYPEAAGLVAYRDARAGNNGSANEVQLNGGATMVMFGGMYFPTSDVVVNGNSDIGYSSCLGVIGYNMSFSGSSDTQVDVSGCAGFAPYATISTVRLVE